MRGEADAEIERVIIDEDTSVGQHSQLGQVAGVHTELAVRN